MKWKEVVKEEMYRGYTQGGGYEPLIKDTDPRPRSSSKQGGRVAALCPGPSSDENKAFLSNGSSKDGDGQHLHLLQ